MTTSPDRSRQSGMVLIVVVMFAALATVLGSGLFYQTSTKVVATKNDINFEKAFYLAETGIERAKAELRTDTNGVNDNLTNKYFSFGSNVVYGDGAFKVSVTDNNDANTNLLIDTDNQIVLWATGIVGNVKRVLSVEVYVPPPTTPFLPGMPDAALAMYGTNDSIYLGNSALIDGRDFEVPSSFDVNGNFTAWGNTLSGDPACTSSVYGATNVSITGPGGPSGGSNAIYGTTSGIPVKVQIGGGAYDAAWWTAFATSLVSKATVIVTNSASPAIGTRAVPVITLVKSNGTLNIANNDDGAGVLIVEGGGKISAGGNYHYEGLVLTLGTGTNNSLEQVLGQGSPTFMGCVVCVGNNVSYSGAGTPTVVYSSDALENLDKLNPSTNTLLQVKSWREIKPQ